MSLLNDVLRDLAGRNALEPIPTVRPVARPPAFRSRRRLVPLGLGVLLLAAGGGLALRHLSHTAPVLRTAAIPPGFPTAAAPVAGRPLPHSRTFPSPLGAPTVKAAHGAVPVSVRKEPAALSTPTSRSPTAVPKTVTAPNPRMGHARESRANRHGIAGIASTPSREATILPARSPLLENERRILRALHNGESAEAWRLARRFAPVRPVLHPRYLELHAAAAAATEHWRAATRLYELLCRLRPSSSTAWSGLALSLLATNRPGPARVALHRALALGVANPILRRYLLHEQRLLRSPSQPR